MFKPSQISHQVQLTYSIINSTNIDEFVNFFSHDHQQNLAEMDLHQQDLAEMDLSLESLQDTIDFDEASDIYVNEEDFTLYDFMEEGEIRFAANGMLVVETDQLILPDIEYHTEQNDDIAEDMNESLDVFDMWDGTYDHYQADSEDSPTGSDLVDSLDDSFVTDDYIVSDFDEDSLDICIVALEDCVCCSHASLVAEFRSSYRRFD